MKRSISSGPYPSITFASASIIDADAPAGSFHPRRRRVSRMSFNTAFPRSSLSIIFSSPGVATGERDARFPPGLIKNLLDNPLKILQQVRPVAGKGILFHNCFIFCIFKLIVSYESPRESLVERSLDFILFTSSNVSFSAYRCKYSVNARPSRSSLKSSLIKSINAFPVFFLSLIAPIHSEKTRLFFFS